MHFLRELHLGLSLHFSVSSKSKSISVETDPSSLAPVPLPEKQLWSLMHDVYSSEQYLSLFCSLDMALSKLVQVAFPGEPLGWPCVGSGVVLTTWLSEWNTQLLPDSSKWASHWARVLSTVLSVYLHLSDGGVVASYLQPV